MKVTQKKLDLFKFEERSKLNKLLLYSEYNENDDYSHFIYDSSFYISIWEFKKMGEFSLDSCKIILSQNNIYPKTTSAETFHPGGNRPVKVRYNYKIGDNMKIFVSEYSKNVKEIKSTNYLGVFGNIDEISICSNSEELVTYLSPSNLNNFMFFILRDEKGFYMITIESDKYFDENMLNIFSL